MTDENHIVLLDFGLSKDFQTGGTGNLNSASVAGYSPHFASMEQIRGTGTDPRSDIYSLSATLYQLLANAIPADALTRADARLGGKPDPIIPLSQHNPEVTPDVSDVILAGLAIRQEERFGSAAEMQKALRRAFNGGSVPVGEKTLVLDAPPVGAAKNIKTSDIAAQNQGPSSHDATLRMGNALPVQGSAFSGAPPEARSVAPADRSLDELTTY